MSKAKQRYSGALRPSEKVLSFFREELEPDHAGTGNRLPTIKEISRHLDVSISTVQAVFAELSRQGRLTMIPGKGTFLNGTRGSALRTEASRRTIAVLIYEQELTGVESTWGKEICAGMLREAANNRKEKPTIHPFFTNTHGLDERLIRAEIAHSSAAIAFPGPHSARIAEIFQATGKPLIHITPPSLDATTDFVSPDFLDICRHIAECWRATGRKRVTALFHTLLTQGTSCARALAGLEMGLQEPDGSDAGLRYHSLDAQSSTDIAPRMEALFRAGPPPDAIYASGDNIAVQAVDWLLARRIRVPEEVSVIGGTGLHPAHNATLACTVVQQPFEKIGVEAVRMALRAIQSGNEPQPGKFIRATIRAERTTRKVENEWFRKQEKSRD